MTEKTTFDPDQLDPEKRQVIAKIEAEVFQNLKKGTVHAFDLGRSLFQASTLLSDAEMNGWLADRFDMTPRHGRNYAAVHRNLQATASAVLPTALPQRCCSSWLRRSRRRSRPSLEASKTANG